MPKRISVYETNNGELSNIGYLLTDSFNPERCYNLINWHCRKHAKLPENLFLTRDKVLAQRGICFEDEETNTWHLALSIDWLSGSREDIEKYVKENVNNKLWLL